MPLPEQQTTGIIIERFAGDEDPVGFDATLESIHTRISEITSSPIERGGDVVDHKRRLPIAYRFTSIILTDDPDPLLTNERSNVLRVGADPATLPPGLALNPTRATDVYRALLAIDEGDLVVTVYTDIEVLEEMMIEGIESTVLGNGDALQIIGNMRQVQFATAEVVELPRMRLSKKKRKGVKSGKRRDAAQLRSKDFFTFTADELF